MRFDPNLPVANVGSLEKIISESNLEPRFYMLLLSIFASVALLLAAIGIFGVLSYAVSQRTREIGIRMALGAPARTVVSLIVRQAMVLVVSGIAAGTIAALFVSETMAKMLFSVTPTDPVTFAGVAAVPRRRRAVRQLPARTPRDPRRPDRRAPRRVGFRLWALGFGLWLWAWARF